MEPMDSVLNGGAGRFASRDQAAIAAAAKAVKSVSFHFIGVLQRRAQTMREILMMWDSVNVIALFVLFAAFLWIIVSKWLR
jgi:hypothetical protein